MMLCNVDLQWTFVRPNAFCRIEGSHRSLTARPKWLLIGNRRDRSVDLGETNGELLVVSQRSILKNTNRQSLAQFYG